MPYELAELSARFKLLFDDMPKKADNDHFRFPQPIHSEK